LRKATKPFGVRKNNNNKGFKIMQKVEMKKNLTKNIFYFKVKSRNKQQDWIVFSWAKGIKN
jgi:hypothetical protein